MFDNKKYVEEYRANDVAEQLGLDRPKLIRMAHLLGSDYTTGISGIGTGASAFTLSPTLRVTLTIDVAQAHRMAHLLGSDYPAGISGIIAATGSPDPDPDPDPTPIQTPDLTATCP